MQRYDSTKIEEDMIVVRLKKRNFKLPLHINYMRDIQGGGRGGGGMIPQLHPEKLKNVDFLIIILLILFTSWKTDPTSQTIH